jgi:hypothetical protein
VTPSKINRASKACEIKPGWAGVPSTASLQVEAGHNCLVSRKSSNFNIRVLIFFYILRFVNISTKGTKSENNIFVFIYQLLSIL